MIGAAWNAVAWIMTGPEKGDGQGGCNVEGKGKGKEKCEVQSTSYTSYRTGWHMRYMRYKRRKHSALMLC